MVSPTIGHVHLIVHHLVATEDDTWFHLPHKETVVQIHMASHILLHGQIKRQVSDLLCIRQVDI